MEESEKEIKEGKEKKKKVRHTLARPRFEHR